MVCGTLDACKAYILCAVIDDSSIDLISKDKQKAPTTDQLNGSYTMPLYQYPPATPPIFVDEGVRR